MALVRRGNPALNGWHTCCVCGICVHKVIQHNVLSFSTNHLVSVKVRRKGTHENEHGDTEQIDWVSTVRSRCDMAAIANSGLDMANTLGGFKVDH